MPTSPVSSQNNTPHHSRPSTPTDLHDLLSENSILPYGIIGENAQLNKNRIRVWKTPDFTYPEVDNSFSNVSDQKVSARKRRHSHDNAKISPENLEKVEHKFQELTIDPRKKKARLFQNENRANYELPKLSQLRMGDPLAHAHPMQMQESLAQCLESQIQDSPSPLYAAEESLPKNLGVHNLGADEATMLSFLNAGIITLEEILPQREIWMQYQPAPQVLEKLPLQDERVMKVESSHGIKSSSKFKLYEEKLSKLTTFLEKIEYCKLAIGVLCETSHPDPDEIKYLLQITDDFQKMQNQFICLTQLTSQEEAIHYMRSILPNLHSQMSSEGHHLTSSASGELSLLNYHQAMEQYQLWIDALSPPDTRISYAVLQFLNEEITLIKNTTITNFINGVLLSKMQNAPDPLGSGNQKLYHEFIISSQFLKALILDDFSMFPVQLRETVKEFVHWYQKQEEENLRIDAAYLDIIGSLKKEAPISQDTPAEELVTAIKDKVNNFLTKYWETWRCWHAMDANTKLLPSVRNAALRYLDDHIHTFHTNDEIYVSLQEMRKAFEKL